jgi:peroxiredoxin
MILGLALAWAAILVGCWLGWQLLRQNGRILLRLDELEKRLDKLEFGEDEQPAGLPLSSDAPSFELPDLAGETTTLAQYRGRSLLLIFFNPACGFCRELLPKLAALPLRSSRREEAQFKTQESKSKTDQSLGTSAATNGEDSQCDSRLVIISIGDAESNRQLFNEHQLSCPVLLQKEMEVAAAYKANGTPSGYLINSEGKIASGFAIGAEALLEIAGESRRSRREEAQTSSAQSSSGNGHREDQGLVTSAATNRFSNRSLAKSKIKRDGLKAGTPAPDFRLPRLDGRGELGLSDFRGRRVLLVFSSPNCGPCSVLAPALEKFHRANRARQQTVIPLSSRGGEGKGEEASDVEVVMISKGEPKENRAKVKEHGLTFPILLQQQWEISRRYAMFATPIAYLIDEHGIIIHDVAVGTDAIQNLLNDHSSPAIPEQLQSTNR